jgi:hypothetical protein
MADKPATTADWLDVASTIVLRDKPMRSAFGAISFEAFDSSTDVRKRVRLMHVKTANRI